MQIQITDQQFPIAKLNLETGESSRIQQGSMIYHTSGVKLSSHLNGSGKGIGKIMSSIGRTLTSDEDLLITKATAKQAGTIAIAANLPGEIVSLECGNNQYFINDGKFLAITENADYKMHKQRLSKGVLSGNGGLFIMETKGNGHVLVNAFGSISRLHLDNDEITVDNDHVVAWDANLSYDIHLESGFWQSIGTGEGIVNKFKGTGDILIQSLNLSNFADELDPFLISSSN